MTTVLLVRHCETDWNLERRWQGHADRPLTEEGRRHARRLAEELAVTPLDAVYSSDLRRAAETASIVAARQGAEVVLEPALREIHVGEWEGLTTAEIESRFPEGWRRHVEGGDGWERGEPHAAMSDRVVAAVSRIASAHPDGTVLCVLHGGTIRAVLAHAEGVELGEYRRSFRGPLNGSVSRIAVESGLFRRID